jgi:hypothetical protein
MSDELGESVRHSALEQFAGDGRLRYRRPRVAGLYGGKTRRFAVVKAHISYSRRLSRTPQSLDDRTRWLTNSGISGFNIG